MTLLALLVLVGGVYYPPPNSYDASRAIAQHIADERYQGDITAFGGVNPADARLESCAPDDARAVQTAHGIWQVFSGYNCIFMVSFESGPDYKIEGFFHYDGDGWYYYGPLRPPLVVESDTFDRYRKGSKRTPKPGSILYNGGSGQASSRFDGILNWDNALLSPVEQPYHADIYSIEEE